MSKFINILDHVRVLIDLRHLKTILKAVLNVRTDYKYRPKSSSENITTSKENLMSHIYRYPYILLDIWSRVIFSLWYIELTAIFALDRHDPESKDDVRITLNVGCDECGSTYLSSFFSLALSLISLPSIQHRQERGESAYVCVWKKRRMYRTKVKRSGRGTTPVIKRAAAPVSA